MQPQKALFSAIELSAVLLVGTAAIAADLPPSGTIKIHSTLKGNSQAVDVGEKHIMGAGNGWGVLYNDAGSGPLHLGTWMCTWTFHNVNSPLQFGGSCEFSNAGGSDKIYTAYTGASTDTAGLNRGTGTIIGGMGKFAGAQGKVVWECNELDPAQGLSACTQEFDYQLP